MNVQRRFTSRRVHNLRDLTSTSGLKSGDAYKRRPLDNNHDTIDDEAESDPELQALRLAVFVSKKRDSTNPALVRSRERFDNNPTRNHAKEYSSDHRALQGRKQPELLSSPEKSYSKASPKLEDLDIEDLKQRIRTKKRSRYGRRNDSDSDKSSSEDDYYEYNKSRRVESSHDDLSPNRFKPSPSKNGSDSNNLGLQRQTSQNSSSIHGRPSRTDRQNSTNLSAKPSTGSSNNTTIVTKPMEEESAPTADAAMMERRRQKFQSGIAVNPEEKSKVSLASLKSNPPSSSLRDAESMPKTTSD